MELDLDAIEAAAKALPSGPYAADHNAVVRANEIETQGFTEAVCVAFPASNAERVTVILNAAPELTRRIREQDATIAELRALCGDALEWIGNRQPDIAPESLVYLMARLRAASKGEQ